MSAADPNSHAIVTGSANFDKQATKATEIIVNVASSENATFCRLKESKARSSQHVAESTSAGPASACRYGPVPRHLSDSTASVRAGASMAKATYGPTNMTNTVSTRPAAKRPTEALVPRLAMPKNTGEMAA